MLTADGGHLLVTNAASDDVSVFEVSSDGLVLRETVRSGDAAPRSVAEHNDLVYVLNTGAPSLVGFRFSPVVNRSSGPTPYGFAFAGDSTLVVTEAFGAMKGKAAASSYAITNGSVAPVSPSVGNGRSEICWAVTSQDGKYVFTTNFAGDAVEPLVSGRSWSTRLAGLRRA